MRNLVKPPVVEVVVPKSNREQLFTTANSGFWDVDGESNEAVAMRLTAILTGEAGGIDLRLRPEHPSDRRSRMARFILRKPLPDVTYLMYPPHHLPTCNRCEYKPLEELDVHIREAIIAAREATRAFTALRQQRSLQHLDHQDISDLA